MLLPPAVQLVGTVRFVALVPSSRVYHRCKWPNISKIQDLSLTALLALLDSVAGVAL
jgi:hypothetical protein